MASTTITGLVELVTAPASGDWFVLVDVSDTTQSPTGSTKKILTSTVFTSPTLTGTVNAAALNLSGNFAIGTTKFTVAATTGNTIIAGTLAVTGVITTSATNGFTLGHLADVARIQYGSSSPTFYSFYTAANALASLEADSLSATAATVGTVLLTAAASRIVPGATSLSLRNTANSADNLIILDAGGATFRTSVAVTTALTAASVAVTAGLTTSGATGAGLGYATGAGGAVSQSGSHTTSVTLNTLCGAITLYNGGVISSGGTAAFTVTNSTVAATDTVIVAFKSGVTTATGMYATVTAVAGGSFQVNVVCPLGSDGNGSVLNFTVIKTVAA